MAKEEIWKDVIGFKGLYKVSSYGRILDLKTGRLRKLVKDKDGYYQLGLTKNKKRTFHKVHRLVAIAFVENPSALPVINHKNEDKTDNRPINLEWCTREYNNSYGTKGKSIVIADGTGNILKRYPSIRSAMRENRMDKQTITRLCNQEIKSTDGSIWKFESK